MEKKIHSVSIVDSCDQLAVESFDQTKIFSSAEWYKLQQAILDTSEAAVQVYSCEDASVEGACMILPCYSLTSQCFGYRITKLFSLSNYYTPLFFPPGGDLSSSGQFRRLIEHILNTRQITSVVLRPVDMENALWHEYLSILRDNKWVCFVEFEFGNWFHNVDESYTEYFNARPTVVKNTYKRKLRKFNTLENSRIDIVCDSDRLSSYILDYNRVYKNSWKENEPNEHFMPDFITLAASRGELRLGFAYIGDTPISAHLWLVSAGVASIFKLSYDKEYSRFSPGTLVMCEMLRHVIDIDKVNRVDFLSGDDHYKSDWMSSRREMKSIKAYKLLSFGGALYTGIYLVKLLLSLTRISIRRYYKLFRANNRASSCP